MEQCPHCLGEHPPAPEGVYIDYRGWRFTPPFICMGCGIETCHVQWAYSRSCGPCDVNPSPTRRLLYACFGGPREAIAPQNPFTGVIMAGDFIDPKDRDKFPPIDTPEQVNSLRNFHELEP